MNRKKLTSDMLYWFQVRIRIQQASWRRRMDFFHNGPELLQHNPKDWGNASAEVAAGGVHTESAQRDEESMWFLECEELLDPRPPKDEYRDSISYHFRTIFQDV